ncbi:MAG: haloacid dehalogenase type II [Rubrivivax sp.]|nr:haloacid dehalogenase type II [Rubrivivax sp.]MDP3085257.1 haloacid dehalogenase type II [Rubrivivax sp.]
MKPAVPRAIVFDVFGTVVDWHSSIVRELVRTGLAVDARAFAEAWRAGYPPAMDEVRRGVLPWTTVDGLHRRILDRLLAKRGLVLPEVQAAELNRIWHRLDAWPDSVAGLTRMKARWPIATLSNGNLSMLVDMARHASLPWDAVLSAELFGHYKPDPEVYLGAARLLDVAPADLLMVAAHPSDLRAAAACGLRTAYVARPAEHGPGGPVAPWADGEFDFAARDLVDLARQLEHAAG